MAARGLSCVHLLPLLAFAAAQPHAGPTDLAFNVDMGTFLADHDLLWDFRWSSASTDHIPTFWFESAYIGNGMMGGMLTVENTTCGCPLVCDPLCRCPDAGQACAASWCEQAVCPASDPKARAAGPAAGLLNKTGPHAADVCPHSSPQCVGYDYGTHLGSCAANGSSSCALPPAHGPVTAKLRQRIFYHQASDADGRRVGRTATTSHDTRIRHSDEVA